MKNIIRALFIQSLILLLIAGCSSSQGTSTGNPVVAVQFKSYAAMNVQSSDPLVEPLAVSNLKMCFKRLRFKPVAGLVENIDLILDEMNIVTSGTLVATASVPPGTYSRVEFDLDPHCVSGKSVQVTNSAGSFTTNQTITIRFDGTLVLSASQNLNLDIQSIITALNTATSDADIKIKAESVGGAF